MSSLPDWLVASVSRALLGEVYASIRAIALVFSKRALTIRYYIDKDPDDFDFESVEVVATNLGAAVGRDQIEQIHVECLFASGPLGEIDPLDGFIYCRREYET